MLKYSIGLDVSKASFHACISVIDHNQTVKVKSGSSFDNNEAGFKAFLAWTQKHHKDPTKTPACH